MLDHDYKFYLAFEDSNCREFINENLFMNALDRNVLPIVMGAPHEYYKQMAPPQSYIHVEDFKPPKHLAEYLHLLDKKDELYTSHFKWKGTGEFHHNQNGSWCQMCAMLHDEKFMSTRRWYKDVNKWSRSEGMCIKGLWPHSKKGRPRENQLKSRIFSRKIRNLVDSKE